MSTGRSYASSILHFVSRQSIADHDHSIRTDQCNAFHAWLRLVLAMVSAASGRSSGMTAAFVHVDTRRFHHSGGTFVGDARIFTL